MFRLDVCIDCNICNCFKLLTQQQLYLNCRISIDERVVIIIYTLKYCICL